MRYVRNLVILFAFSLTIISEHPAKDRETSTHSAQMPLFERRLDTRVARFDTAGRTLVAAVVDLAFTYQLPTAIEYADRDATTRALSMQFRNESIRGILKTIIQQFPEYDVNFSGGIVDVFAPKGREDHSNLLNKVIKDFAVTQTDTHEATYQLFCAVGREVGSQVCAGSIAIGQWGPLKITLHLQNAKVYEALNAIVAQNGKAIWTVMVRPEKLSTLQGGDIRYVYPLQQPFKATVSERLARLNP